MYERIRELREDKGLGQKDLADYLKVHQTTYSDYELGNLNIPVAILIKLSVFYNTSIDYLLGQTDNPNQYERKCKKISKKFFGRLIIAPTKDSVNHAFCRGEYYSPVIHKQTKC